MPKTKFQILSDYGLVDPARAEGVEAAVEALSLDEILQIVDTATRVALRTNAKLFVISNPTGGNDGRLGRKGRGTSGKPKE